MNADKSYVTLTTVIFGFIGLVQLTRAFQAWEVVINGFAVPVVFSWFAGAAFLGLAAWGVAQLRRG